MTAATGRQARCCSQEQRRRWHGVAIPPIRLRLNLRVQVEQVQAELLRIGGEVRAIGTRFAFGHPGLLSGSALRLSPRLLLTPRELRSTAMVASQEWCKRLGAQALG